VEAYETRVAKTEKKRLMVPIPLDEALKSKVCSHKTMRSKLGLPLLHVGYGQNRRGVPF